MNKKIICIDFDGVIHDNLNYVGSSIINGKLINGAKESLEVLSESYEVVVHSARCQDINALHKIKQWLEEHDMPYEVMKHKPNAYIFVDDRGIGFNGNWDKAMQDINDFKQWQEKEKRLLRSARQSSKNKGVRISK